MTKKIVLISAILFHIHLFGQTNYIPYYNITSEAEWHYDNGRYNEAESLFEEAFKLMDVPKTKDIWLYSIILSKKGKKNKVYRLLKNSIKEIGGVQKKIDPYLKEVGIELSDRQIKKLNSFPLDTTTSKYKEESKTIAIIDSIFQVDQLSRKKMNWLDSIWWITGQDSVYRERSDVIAQVNTSNFSVLKNLIQDGKLNNNRVIGAHFSILLLHMIPDQFMKIEEDLLQMIKEGCLDPWYFARAKDRIYTEKGSCIIYYAFPFATENLTCIPYDKILENRKSIGLSTYYSRPSFSFYIRPRRMMKLPFREFYESELERKK